MNYLDRKRNTKRDAIALSIAAALHVLLIYGLVTGLGKRMIDVVRGPLETQVIAETKPPQAALPPPPALLAPTPPVPFIPTPVVQIDSPPATPAAIASVSQSAPPVAAAFAPAAPAPAVADTDVSAVPIGGASPEYPDSMQEDGRAGWATVGCMVGTDGHTSGCHVIETFGGSPFGTAAKRFAENEVYRPATHNGVPIAKARIWKLEFSFN